jgi:hypothetical protein
MMLWRMTQLGVCGKTIVVRQKFNDQHISNNRRTPYRNMMLKKATFSPAQPWRLFHLPALSLPRQTLRPRTRLVPSKVAASEQLNFER